MAETPVVPDPFLQQIIDEQKAAEEQARIKSEQNKKRNEAIRSGVSSVFQYGKILGEFEENVVNAIVSAYVKRQRHDDAVYKTRGYEEAAVKAAKAYASNPTQANYNKYLKEKAAYEKVAQEFQQITGEPWKVITTPEPEPKATEPVVQTNANTQSLQIQQDAETARENRRTGVAPASLPPSGVNVNDPRVQAYIKIGFTPEMAMAKVQSDIAAAGGGPGGGGSGTQIAYKLFTQQQTAGFANSMAQQLLGRDLSAEEIAKATEAINLQSKKSPTVTKTSGSTTVQTGGIDENVIVKEQIKVMPEYANYQQATTYFDAMLGALRGPAGGGI